MKQQKIDGAVLPGRVFLYVTIPSIKEYHLRNWSASCIIWVANSVDVIFNMTEGGPAYSTQNTECLHLQQGKRAEFRICVSNGDPVSSTYVSGSYSVSENEL